MQKIIRFCSFYIHQAVARAATDPKEKQLGGGAVLRASIPGPLATIFLSLLWTLIYPDCFILCVYLKIFVYLHEICIGYRTNES